MEENATGAAGSVQDYLYPLSQNHRIIGVARAYKAIESNPLLNAGIEIKAYLTGGSLIFF